MGIQPLPPQSWEKKNIIFCVAVASISVAKWDYREKVVGKGKAILCRIFSVVQKGLWSYHLCKYYMIPINTIPFYSHLFQYRFWAAITRRLGNWQIQDEPGHSHALITVLTMFSTFISWLLVYFHHHSELLLSTIVNDNSVYSAFWGSRQFYSNGLPTGEKGCSEFNF